MNINFLSTFKNQSGVTGIELMIILGIVVVIGGVFIVTLDGVTCSGQCATVKCDNISPCPMDTDGDGKLDECYAGKMCASGVAGTICEDNWWWFDDCICANKAPQKGTCKAVCVKP